MYFTYYSHKLLLAIESSIRGYFAVWSLSFNLSWKRFTCMLALQCLPSSHSVRSIFLHFSSSFDGFAPPIQFFFSHRLFIGTTDDVGSTLMGHLCYFAHCSFCLRVCVYIGLCCENFCMYNTACKISYAGLECCLFKWHRTPRIRLFILQSEK